MLLKNKIKAQRLALPTPYPIGDIFSYVILDDPVTVIDLGVKTGEVEARWREALSRLRLTFRDVKRVLLTHGHSDHFGFAKRFLELSGAVLYLHPDDFSKVVDRRGYYMRMGGVLKELGVPENYLYHFETYLEKEALFCEDLDEEVLNPIQEGDLVEFDHFSLRVVHTPGHSSGHVVFLFEKEAFTGDMIFSNMTPDPIIDVRGDVRVKTSLEYFSSINKLLTLGLEVFYPSHREESGDFPEAVKNLKMRYEIKERIIYDVFKRKGSLTPFQLVCELYPEVSPKEIFVILSDIIGRLDIMEEKGIVICQKRDGVFYYCLS